MADLFRFKHVAAANAAQPVLNGIDLGQVVQKVEAHDQFIEIARHESGSHLVAGLGCAGQAIIVGSHHFFLLHHGSILDDFLHRRPGGDNLRLCRHAALHSLIESAKVPACSRIGCIWPEFSAYLNAM